MATAWVTLVTNDGYAVGALVLAHSLRISGTRHQLHVMFTEGVSAEVRAQLNDVFDHSSLVNVLDSRDTENLALIGRPDLGVTFTKLHCWRLTQYTKCVFLDADTLVIQNSDELFDRPEFSAAPDIGWPDFFNSGVFVFTPSTDTYHKLIEFAVNYGTFDGGDQGLLNQYFSNWRELDASHRLPFIYNTTTSAIYSYAAALKKYGASIKIVHFLGTKKPWHAASGGHISAFLDLWQNIYHSNVKEHIPHGTNPSYITFVPSAVPPPKEEIVNKEERYSAWDQGAPDYAGRDSFANIQKQIEASLQEKLVESKMDPPQQPEKEPELPVHEAQQPDLEPEHHFSEHGTVPEASTPPAETGIPATDKEPVHEDDPVGHALQETAESETVTMTSEEPPKPSDES